ncbi:hypothetical protein EGW08_003233 [Elysia chlorotica]|uniref:phosphatidate phosphatase n=1 Tax=Elysia chlorotica TaxID=188477 RepID=A0A3S0ZY90_ELYCH|nr:hypothetical protein EGW08_003233 [Elysia chlorotica]
MSLAFVGRIVQSLKGFYNGINPATLTGAIDVVIVKQPDGTYHSSPFHVRFGKLGVLRSREKVVDIEINGEPIDLQMKLGEAGEAFFVQEIESEEEEDVPAYLATSPLPHGESVMEAGVMDLHRQVLEEEEATVSEASTEPTAFQPHPSHSGQFRLQAKRGSQSSNSSGVTGSPRDPASIAVHSTVYLEVGANGKPRRKVLKKKKQHQKQSQQSQYQQSNSHHNHHHHHKSGGGRSGLRSVSMPESVSEEAVIFDMEESTSDESVDSSDDLRMPPGDALNIPRASRPSTPKSDTEVDKRHVEESHTSILVQNSATWAWGMFPTNLEAALPQQQTRQDGDTKSSGGFMSIWNKQPSSSTQTSSKTALEGIYLDDLTSMDDPEMARIYLGQPRSGLLLKEEDTESGRGQSLPQSPNSVEGAIGGPSVSFTMSEVRHLGPVALSLCGGLHDPESLSLDKFMQKVVTFDDLAQNPNITSNPDLVVKIHDKFYNWTTAAPMVLSQIVFHKQLPDPAVKDLEKEHMPKKKKKKSWFSWGRSAEAAEEDGLGALTDGSAPTDAAPGDPSGSASSTTVTSETAEHGVRLTLALWGAHRGETTSTAEADDLAGHSVSLDLGSPEPLDDEDLEMLQERRRRHSTVSDASGSGKNRREKFIKSLRLSSEQISKMGLRPGHNEVMFSVTTQYQGTTRCMSNVYLWNHDDKIVISDIDGTITKSDVLGQILPIIGRDWSQSGVAQLFTRIDENGYKLIYLSARAIGQSRSTKDMLKSIRQGGLVLPNGPLFLNPTSLFSAFHREVILKNPEEFKISCLKDIADLFPSSPFIAGFGNKLNDVIAYRALDIPKSRIFTINPQGQLRHDLSLTFHSSYTDMSDLVDHLFPCRDHVDRGAASEFTGVSYWRDPIPALSDAELALITGELTGTAAVTTATTAASSDATTSAPDTVTTTIELQIELPKQ